MACAQLSKSVVAAIHRACANSPNYGTGRRPGNPGPLSCSRFIVSGVVPIPSYVWSPSAPPVAGGNDDAPIAGETRVIYIERERVAEKRHDPLGPVMTVLMVVSGVAAGSMIGPLLALIFFAAAPLFLDQGRRLAMTSKTGLRALAAAALAALVFSACGGKEKTVTKVTVEQKGDGYTVTTETEGNGPGSPEYARKLLHAQDTWAQTYAREAQTALETYYTPNQGYAWSEQAKAHLHPTQAQAGSARSLQAGNASSLGYEVAVGSELGQFPRFANRQHGAGFFASARRAARVDAARAELADDRSFIPQLLED